MSHLPDDLPDPVGSEVPCLQERKVVGFEEQKQRDQDAHKLRNEAMKRRREQQDAEDRERQQRIMKEVEQIRQQANGRKKGWL
jgi:hypothetical protein